MGAFTLPSGKPVGPLGQGTWAIGDSRSARAEEIAALKLGLDLGLVLIDTAEMYGDGRSEDLVGEAIAGRRDDVFLVSKVLPRNATRRDAVEACKRSLKRLRTDYLDLYLLHWRESQPLGGTLEAFVALQAQGLIREYGVSNFDTVDMEEAFELPGGGAIATNQVLYNLKHRGIEWELLPWCREHDLPVMAYTPLGNSGAEQRSLLGNTTAVATRHAATAAQVALAWLLRQDGVVVIPKAGRRAHVRENSEAVELARALTREDLEELDAAFPRPRRKAPLEML